MLSNRNAGLDLREVRHFHLFCGLGGGAKGFNRGSARVGNMRAVYRCIGGVDNDAASIRDFSRNAGVKGTLLDLFDRSQYMAFHGHEPPADWHETTPEDIRVAAGGERPHVIFLSPPCKGFSGLLNETRSKSARYQALNRLATRGLFLALEAFRDNPPELIILENVPRIQTRGAALLDQIGQLLRSYGYAVAETTHDCGVIGGLAQSRKRFLLVARHVAQVRPFLYEPPSRKLRGVGEILERLPLPGDPRGGAMHRVPALQWQTWVRLAFVEAGGDWRSLNKLRVEDGILTDFALLPDSALRSGALGVTPWTEPSGTVAGESFPTNGKFAVADPRYVGKGEYGQLGVRDWTQTLGAVTGQASPGQGGYSVADPRPVGSDKHSQRTMLGVTPWDQPSAAISGRGTPTTGRYAGADPRPKNNRSFNNTYPVAEWEKPCKTVIGAPAPVEGALSTADPRHHGNPKFSSLYRIIPWSKPSVAVTGANGGTAAAVADPRPANDMFHNAFRTVGWKEPSLAITGQHAPTNGAISVADPRPTFSKTSTGDYSTQGNYGVVPWTEPTGAVSAAACHDNGRWAVADPREPLPAATDRLVAVIQSLDGTWHRPLTTLELAALQSLVDPDDLTALDGSSDTAWRERIGNAVPPDAAQAIADTMALTLLLAWSGEGFALSDTSIWVRPIAVALSVQPADIPA